MNSSIWPIDGALTGATTPDQSGPGNNDNEGVLYILQTSRLEPHHKMQFNVIIRKLIGGRESYFSVQLDM